MAELEEKEIYVEKPTKHLQDEYHFCCSNCSRNLAHVTVTEKLPFGTKVRAECPFCGDHSDIHDIFGLFNVGCEECTKLNDFSEIVIDGSNVHLIHLVRA